MNLLYTEYCLHKKLNDTNYYLYVRITFKYVIIKTLLEFCKY